MEFEKRKSPKIKVKRKDDDVSSQGASEIKMKRRVPPSRSSAEKKKREPVKTAPQAAPEAKEKRRLRLIKGGRQKSSRRKRKAMISVICALVIIAMIVVLNFVTPTGIVEWSQNKISSWGSGGGMPVTVGDDSVRGIYSRNSCIYVLTDSHTYAYNSSGKQINAIQHGYNSPVFELSDSRVLTYDRGSFGLRIDAIYTNFINTQFDEEIITADICDRGSFAVATDSNDYSAVVTVYDKNFKTKFRWSSPDGQVSCVELSENGRYLAVCTVGGKNGDYCSTVNIFNVSSGETVAKQEYLSKMLINSFTSKDHFTFVGTDTVVTFKYDGTDKVEHEYFGLELFNADYKGKMVAAYHPGGDERRFTAAVLGTDGRETDSFTVDSGINRICIDSKYIYTYYNGTVSRYTYDGKMDRGFKTGYEYVYIAPFRKQLAVISDMKLDILE